jgi:Flp pilus assembly protein CpaB
VQAVTLIVDPEGAERMALGLHEGKLHLVLRNPGDLEIAEVKSVTTGEMLSDGREPAAKPARVRPAPKAKAPVPAVVAQPKVTIIKGVKIEKQEPAMPSTPPASSAAAKS